MTKNNKKFFNSLQIYRGIAAIMVIIHHLYPQASYFLGFENNLLKELALMGKFGVDFFFVLSGFIIAWTSYNKEGKAKYLFPYFKNRFLRIFVPYLPIGILLFILYKELPQISQGATIRNITWQASLFLIPYGVPALGVAWTLMYELMFYVFFSVWFVSKKILYSIFGLWVLILLYQLFLNPINHNTQPIIMLMSHYNLEFILGVVVALLYRKNMFPNKRILFLSFLLLFLIFLYLFVKTHEIKLGLIFSIACALLIALSLNSKLDNVSKNSFSMKIGNASYSIYLIHGTLISILVRIFAKYLSQIPIFLVLIIIVLTCIISGIIYSNIFEKWIMNYFKKRFLN